MNPFAHPFLSQFSFTPKALFFTDKELFDLDQKLEKQEQLSLSLDLEKILITKNEFLASFAISKAEQSQLTLEEAKNVYELVVNQESPHFLTKKIKAGLILTQKDHDKLEFFNIAKTFRYLNKQNFTINDLTPELILKIHHDITHDMDLFKKILSGFTPYNSGRWRDNDLIVVGDYTPAPFAQIKDGINELIEFVKKHQNPTGIAVFHTALYALHPFNNGNKRACRILEHLLLRSCGLNRQNLYSPSYYYHKEKARYYKNLLTSLLRRNFNPFVSFAQEAIALSIVSVVKTSLELKRAQFLNDTRDEQIKLVLRPLVKQKKVQFKNLIRISGKKMARQTFVNYLQKAVETNVVEKITKGKATYYHLNFKPGEEKLLGKWLNILKEKSVYIPDEFLLA